MGTASCVLVVGLLWILLAASTVVGNNGKTGKTVTYDKRSLMISGNKDIFFSGEIHYPRMPPEMWPDIIRKAKEGGLNVIQTYVFWNLHEPVQGQFNFEGNYDVVKFIKLIGDMGLYCTLRVGPYLEAEWNFGGFPYWLKEVPNITFRTYNEPFMNHMKKYAEMVVDMMKKANLFAPQGGPIIMAQIENEYSTVQYSYYEMGKKYVNWAAEMAVGLYKEIPWIMCKQKQAPPAVITTCNGRHCANNFHGPNGPNKPWMWTENWTAQYRVFGDPPSQRSAEDIAFAVARFFAKNGTYVSYYMYYGGTNYGRTSSSFIATGYYDEAPLDEYGLYREPKWSHLRDCHTALRHAKKPLLYGTQTVQRIGSNLEITTWENPNLKLCVAFLANNHTKKPSYIHFRGTQYYLPALSVSILPDCKNNVFNTQCITAQHNARNFVPSKVATILKWEMFEESIPTIDNLSIKNPRPLELYSLSKDTSDYAWYSTRINFNRLDLPVRADILPVLRVDSLGHAILAFVNGEFVGSLHGENTKKSFEFRKPVNLKTGDNDITILGILTGYPNSGANMERRFSGLRAVELEGLMTGTLDITFNGWAHSVGISGEKLQLYTHTQQEQEEAKKKGVKWTTAVKHHIPVTWYKSYFHAPEGNNPVALKMTSMAKGMVWINGKSIGRYWVSFLSPVGQPTQTSYHVPRSFLKPKNNLIVVFEEIGGDPSRIEVLLVNRDTICSSVRDYYPANVNHWERKGDFFRPLTAEELIRPSAVLTCAEDKVISKIEFASYGSKPEGACGNYLTPECSFPNANKIVEKACLGKNHCKVPMERSLFQEGAGASKDLCPNTFKSLTVQAKCVRQGTKDD